MIARIASTIWKMQYIAGEKPIFCDCIAYQDLVRVLKLGTTVKGEEYSVTDNCEHRQWDRKDRKTSGELLSQCNWRRTMPSCPVSSARYWLCDDTWPHMPSPGRTNVPREGIIVAETGQSTRVGARGLSYEIQALHSEARASRRDQWKTFALVNDLVR